MLGADMDPVSLPPTADRRPLSTRQARWAIALAGTLARRRVRPNGISAMSIVFAAAGAAALATWSRLDEPGSSLLLVAGTACIQLRLLCNMLDGMVAIEGGLRSPVGDLWNEVPDRLADALLLASVGYGVTGYPHAVELGWLATTLAVSTAYVRALGGQLAVPGRFEGPMAKPHRMAMLTAASLAAAAVAPTHSGIAGWIMYGGLVLIALGAIVTVLRRVSRIASALRTRAPGAS